MITGSASGLGAATSARLVAAGQRVIGVDRRDADVVADLGTVDGRRQAIAEVTHLCRGRIDGLVTFAGMAGLPDRPGSALASVNYFGSVELLSGLRPLLAEGDDAAALAISSNSTTTQPGVPMDVVAACLAGNEDEARDLADRASSLMTYPATKIAIARWVRRHAPQKDWIGSGITLNALAPGATETAMLAETRADPVIGPFFEQFPIPAGRCGRADEIAALAAFMLGPDARFFCGSVVFADGGTDALLRPDDWPAPHGARSAE